MTRTTRSGKDFLPRGFSAEDLKLAKWFLSIVATVSPGTLHSHAIVIPVSDKQGRRKRTSLSALFHEQWPHVHLVEILTALACIGFITPPQKTAEPAITAESPSYSFQLVPQSKGTNSRAGQKAKGDGQKRHRKVG